MYRIFIRSLICHYWAINREDLTSGALYTVMMTRTHITVAYYSLTRRMSQLQVRNCNKNLNESHTRLFISTALIEFTLFSLSTTVCLELLCLTRQWNVCVERMLNKLSTNIRNSVITRARWLLHASERNSITFTGKPTVISIRNSWPRATGSQLSQKGIASPLTVINRYVLFDYLNTYYLLCMKTSELMLFMWQNPALEAEVENFSELGLSAGIIDRLQRMNILVPTLIQACISVWS